MQIVHVETPQHFQSIRDMFKEYFECVREDLGIDLGYQHIRLLTFEKYCGNIYTVGCDRL